MASERASYPVLAPDPSFLGLEDEEIQFFKGLTRITDDEELKKHIINLSAKAYKAINYPCIRGFAFTKLKISRLPAYPSVLKLMQDRPGAILLDAGCCFGNDLRKAVHDGWPVGNALAFDLEPLLWEYGHELFRSTPQSFPAGFIAGDAFDPNIIKPLDQPFYTPPGTPRPRDLQQLTSLTPLQGHISAIHASSLFHLFDYKKQMVLAYRLASLLSPEPGSIIFGSHRGTEVEMVTNDLMNIQMWCHSPESWKEWWDGGIFRKGTVRVEAELKVTGRKDFNTSSGTEVYFMHWSVTRLGVGMQGVNKSRDEIKARL